MKNKIFSTILVAIIIIFSIQLSVKAVIISTDKQVESGSGTVTISVTSNQLLGAYTLKLTDSAGLTLVGATGGEVSADKKTITGSSAEGTKNLGVYTFNVPTVDKDTKYNIKFSITGMETPSLEPVANETNTAVLTVKAKQVTPEPKPEQKPEPKPETPKELEFRSVNETVYVTGTVNVRKSYSTSSDTLGQLKEGDSVKRIGVSKASAEGYYWSKITYNGKTAYVISSKLTTTKPKQEEPKQEEPKQEEPKVTTEEPVDDGKTQVKGGLKSLEIEGLTLSPAFSPDVYEYRVIVKKDISELTINTVPASEGAKVTIAGNTNLQEGENLVTIIVYNSKGEVEATYQITTNKNTVDLEKTDKILQSGTKQATRNLIIFIALLCVALVALVVIIILKHKNKNYEDYDEEIDNQDYYGNEESTNSEETVENLEETTATDDNKKTKRKGKHF